MEMILGIRAMGRDTPHDPRELQAPSLDTHRDPEAATATLGIPAQPLQPSQPGILSRKGTGRIWGVQQWALPGVAHSLVWHGNILNPHFPQAWSSWLGKQEGSQLFWEEALSSGTPGMCRMPGVFPSLAGASLFQPQGFYGTNKSMDFSRPSGCGSSTGNGFAMKSWSRDFLQGHGLLAPVVIPKSHLELLQEQLPNPAP